MLSKIRSLKVTRYEGMVYVTGYEVELRDRLSEHNLSYIKPPVGERYLTPLQMKFLLLAVRHKCDCEDSSLQFSMKSYKYIDDFIFPMLAINGVPITRYDIPIYTLEVEKIKDEAKQQQYIETVQDQCAEYYHYYDMTNDGEEPEFFPDLIDKDYGVLHSYMNPGTDITKKYHTPEIQVQGWDQSSKFVDPTEADPADIFGKDLPFVFDRNLPNIAIPAPGSILPPDFRHTRNMMQYIQKLYGVSFSIKGIIGFKDETQVKYDAVYDNLCKLFNVNYFNPNARKETREHYGVLLCEVLGEDTSFFKNKKGNFSFTKDTVKQLYEKYAGILATENTELNIARVACLKQVKALQQHNTDLKLIKEIFEGLYPDSGYDRYDDQDRLVAHCGIECESETRRLTTNTPNIQGKNSRIKSLIIPRSENRSIVAIDIKSQEVLILIFSVLQNENLKRLVLETGDCYKAFAIEAGIEYTPETKKLIKIPILSIMNGRTKQSIDAIFRGTEGDISENMKIGDTIYNLIVNDPGYVAAKQRAKSEADKTKFGGTALRNGLFGTVVPAEKKTVYGSDYNSRLRQALNSNFQLTASEITSYCLESMLVDLYNKTNKFGLSLEQLTPIVPIYDEVVFDIDNEVKDEAIELIKFYMLPKVEGWIPMKEELTCGSHYLAKDSNYMEGSED